MHIAQHNQNCTFIDHISVSCYSTLALPVLRHVQQRHARAAASAAA